MSQPNAEPRVPSASAKADLVERARAGDHTAFAILARSGFGRMYGAAKLILRDQYAAEDAVQEALLLAWRHVATIRDPDAWDVWMYRLTVRACYRLAKARGAREVRELHVRLDRPAPATDFAGNLARTRPDHGRADRPSARTACRDRPALLRRPLDGPGRRRPRRAGWHGKVAAPPRPGVACEPRLATSRSGLGSPFGSDRHERRKRSRARTSPRVGDERRRWSAARGGAGPGPRRDGAVRPLPRLVALVVEPPIVMPARVVVGIRRSRLLMLAAALLIATTFVASGIAGAWVERLTAPSKPPDALERLQSLGTVRIAVSPGRRSRQLRCGHRARTCRASRASCACGAGRGRRTSLAPQRHGTSRCRPLPNGASTATISWSREPYYAWPRAVLVPTGSGGTSLADVAGPADLRRCRRPWRALAHGSVGFPWPEPRVGSRRSRAR